MVNIVLHTSNYILYVDIFWKRNGIKAVSSKWTSAVCGMKKRTEDVRSIITYPNQQQQQMLKKKNCVYIFKKVHNVWTVDVDMVRRKYGVIVFYVVYLLIGKQLDSELIDSDG